MSSQGRRILLTGIHGTRPDVYVGLLTKLLNGHDGLPAQHVYSRVNTLRYPSAGLPVDTAGDPLVLSSTLQRAAAQAANLERARRDHEEQLPHHLLVCCDFGRHYLHQLYRQGAPNALLAMAVLAQRTALEAFEPTAVLHLSATPASKKSDDDYLSTMFSICPNFYRIEAVRPAMQDAAAHWTVMSRFMSALNRAWPQSG